jgi:hypothetical protein
LLQILLADGSLETGREARVSERLRLDFQLVPGLYVRDMDISSVFGEEQNELMLAQELR